MISTILSLLSAVVTGVNAWIDFQSSERLRQSGRLDQLLQATRELQAKLEKIRDVDEAIIGGSDPDWTDRLRDEARSKPDAG